MRRFFGKIEKDKAIIEGDELKHLANVIRLKQGDKFILFANDEYDYACQILSIDKKRAVAEILEKKISPTLPKKNIVLFQALPKKEAFDTIVQKACELGASKVVPFSSEFVVNKSGINLERLNSIIMSACKQCERPKVMEICQMISFKEMLEELKQFDKILFANEIDGKRCDLSCLEKSQNIAVIVGCEGGFSEKEKEELLKVDNVLSLTLGSRILRADTASILMLGIASLFSQN